MYRVTQQYPSRQPTTADFMIGTRRTGPKHYTGDEVMGICLLHKQAYSPVTRSDTMGRNADPKRR